MSMFRNKKRVIDYKWYGNPLNFYCIAHPYVRLSLISRYGRNFRCEKCQKQAEIHQKRRVFAMCRTRPARRL